MGPSGRSGGEDLVTRTPLPFTGKLRRREVDTTAGTDGHGNPRYKLGDSVDVPCFWWNPDTDAPSVAGSPSRTVIDRVWVVAAGLDVSRLDEVEFGDGVFVVDSPASNWDHGPYGFAPGLDQIPLKKVAR